MMVFRGKLASASLKAARTPVTGESGAAGIPRQACLGLIEGGTVKRNLERIFWRIPRQACLGLIEGGGSGGHARISWRVFRGKLASASLKVKPHGVPGLLRSPYSEASLPRPH